MEQMIERRSFARCLDLVIRPGKVFLGARADQKTGELWRDGHGI